MEGYHKQNPNFGLKMFIPQSLQILLNGKEIRGKKNIFLSSLAVYSFISLIHLVSIFVSIVKRYSHRSFGL